MQQEQQQKTNGAPEPKRNSLGFDLTDLEVSRESRGRLADMEIRLRDFELTQREATMYAQSNLVPDTYKGNVANCAIALNIAHRIKVDPIMVMQNLYVIHGRPSWSGKFLIAAFNSTGKFTPIRYRQIGSLGTNSYGYIAYVKTRDGELIEGPEVTWGMAVAEGWTTKTDKNGKPISKWLTIPELMFRYRSASFMINTTSPEITMGFPTLEEVLDTAVGAEIIDDIINDGIREGTREDQQVVAKEKIARLEREALARASKETEEAWRRARAQAGEKLAEEKTLNPELEDAPEKVPDPELTPDQKLRKEVQAWVETIPTGRAVLGQVGYESVDQIPELKLGEVLAALKEAMPGNQPKDKNAKPVFGRKQ